MKKKVFAFLIASILVLSVFAGCNQNKPATTDTTTTTVAPEEIVTTGEIGVLKDEEFGGIYINLTVEEFNNLGFKFGDSVDITFDNGKELKDIPYYSGYYVHLDNLLVCGDAAYPHVVIARNNGKSTWDEFEMTENSKVTITRAEKFKYQETQVAHTHKYSDNRNDFESDEMFANFRVVKGGNLKDDYFYRSASPCDNHHNRAGFANKLLEDHNVKFVINMSDDEAEYKEHVAGDDFTSNYYNKLYEEGNVLLLGLDIKYQEEGFTKTFSEALFEMTKHEGPCNIHCVEGKDRTGFAYTLLLALADASPQEIIDDYMLTYYNYFGVTKETNPTKYDAVVCNVNDFLCFLCGAELRTDVNTLDIKAGAENYLKTGGLTDDQIKAIEDYITK
jgi:hypothetical protein